jgi:threonine dehydrogenase-like Zn-dependent dehydrogenase
MRATVMYAAGDVRIESIPDAGLREPTDALVRVTRACICGSDLWPYNLKKPGDPAQRMGHEAIGVVEAVGSEVRTLKAGDVVVMPFASSDGICAFCHEGLPTSCVHVGFFGNGGDMDGAQAEALRVPQADHSVLECVGTDKAIGRVGGPHYETIPASLPAFFKNVTGAAAPLRSVAYIANLLPDVLEGRIEPGRVFDRTVGFGGVPDGYRAMNGREAIKVMVKP